MATKININTKQLHADIKALKDDIDASMRERLVIQCGYEELASQWSGPAAKTYDEGFRNAMTNMKALYSDIKDKIRCRTDPSRKSPCPTGPSASYRGRSGRPQRV